MKTTAILIVLHVCVLGAAFSADGPLLFAGVTGNATHVVFSWSRDLWSVPRDGGEARRLTEDAGDDVLPAFSPDGSRLAFSRSVGRNWDVWLMPAAGGEARRLTYHTKRDWVRGFSSDGERVLFVSGRDGDNLLTLYTIAVDGGMPERLPLPKGYDGAFSPDDRRLAYAPIAQPQESVHYRYYRGGLTSPLWIADLDDSSVEVVAGNDANHHHHVWIGDTIFFTSDRTGTFNLYAYDTASKETRQLTTYDTHGIRWSAAAGDDAIVFARAGRLHLHQIASGRTREIPVSVEREAPELEPKEVAAAGFVTGATLSPDGDRVALNARGDVVVLDPSSGDFRNLTASSGTAERGPVFSPDGRRVAYFSDAAGEYALHVRELAGDAPARVIDVEEHPSFYRQIVFSPDGTQLAFTGKRLGLWLADLEAGTAKRLAVSDYLAQEDFHPDFSPDGRYLAYDLGLPNHQRTVRLHDLETGDDVAVTRGIFAEKPVFDASGRYLYYIASNTAGLAAGNEIWGVLSAQLLGPLVTREIHAVVLREGDVAPTLPLAGDPHPNASFEPAAGPIDLDGLAERAVYLRVPVRDYVGLAAGPPGRLYLRYRKWPDTPGGSAEPLTPLASFDLSKAKSFEEVVEDVDSFTVSRDRRTLLYETGDGWFLLAPGDEGAEPRALDLSNVKIAVRPAAEWRQMFDEAWRLMRDYFYDPGHHGQDLTALAEHYRPYLPQVLRRDDLNDLFREMLGHVSISHMSIYGGDRPQPGPPERTATLGADFEIDRGRYRISRIYRAGSPLAPSLLVSAAPFDQPGVDVREGDYLLAVNDTPIDASKNLYAYLAGLAFKPVRVTVASDPDGGGRRTATVVAYGGDNTLLRANWYEERRRRVEELSDGRLSYIPMPSFGFGSIQAFLGAFVAGASKEGVIIDQRFGPGGTTSDFLIQLLVAPRLHRYAFPYGEDLTVPTSRLPGPRVLLVNEHNASASETFPLMFKLAHVGTIVGQRTAGAGTGGALDYPRLIDGGRITIPNRASYDPEDGTWAENRGVVPDVEVEWWPADWRQGRDPQLEKAVEVALEQIEAREPEPVKRPPYPVHPR